jgi:CelD/BcsL family acetyltransferase involved in cellulose biosynthesis
VRDLEHAIECIEAIELSRWGPTSFYSEASKRAFERDLLRALAERGTLDVYMLYLDGKACAFVWGAVVRNALEVDRVAHDPAAAPKLSIGKVANFHAIEACIAEGYCHYDLTRGSDAYKKWLGGTERANIRFRVYSSRWHRLPYALEREARALARRARWLTPRLRRLRYGSS